MLLVPEGFDRVEAAGLESGIEAEGNPDERRKKERERDGAGLDGHGPAGEARDDALDAEAYRDARRAARQGERERLHQKLRLDVPAPRADRHAHADLARPLRHRDQHDVHDPDASHAVSYTHLTLPTKRI